MVNRENDIPMIKVMMDLTIPTLGHVWPDPPSGYAFMWVWPNMPLGGNCQTHPSFYQGNVPDQGQTQPSRPGLATLGQAQPRPTQVFMNYFTFVNLT